MARTRAPRYGYLVFAALLGFPLGTINASPIPPQITFSTQWPGPVFGYKGTPDAPVLEFQGVENGTATLGTAFKLGTVLVHQTSPTGGYTFDGDRVPVDFIVKAIDGKPIESMGPAVTLDGVIYGSVYPEGTVAASLGFQAMYNRFDLSPSAELLSSFRAGDLTLTLGSPRFEDGRLWSLTPGTPVVAVDIYGVLEAAPIPEPDAWIVCAGAAMLFARNRCRRVKAA